MSTLAASRAAFESKIDDIERLARHHFRGLQPEARDESVQNCLALAWKYFEARVRKGKPIDRPALLSLIGNAITHTKAGRSPQGTGHGKAKCALDYARRCARFGTGERRVTLESARNGLDGLIGDQTTVPDVVAFRIDTRAWMGSLTEHQRGIALDLATGMTTGEIARQRGVGPSAISECRCRLRQHYAAFHKEG